MPGREAPGPRDQDLWRPGRGRTAGRAAVGAQRRRLLALRSAGEIGDDAFHRVEEEVDLLELTADPRPRPAGGAA